MRSWLAMTTLTQVSLVLVLLLKQLTRRKATRSTAVSVLQRTPANTWLRKQIRIRSRQITEGCHQHRTTMSFKQRQHLLRTYTHVHWGTGIRGLMWGMTTLTQGNQELLVIRDKVGRPQVSFGQASPWNVMFSPSVLTLLVGQQEGHPACKKTGFWFVGGDDLTGALHDL